jgi:hypothetical protein
LEGIIWRRQEGRKNQKSNIKKQNDKLKVKNSDKSQDFFALVLLALDGSGSSHISSPLTGED